MKREAGGTERKPRVYILYLPAEAVRGRDASEESEEETSTCSEFLGTGRHIY